MAHATAQAVPILVPDKNDLHKFVLDVEALENLLLQKEVADLPVVVVSVAGGFRQGKSFILNFFLRYMYSLELGNSNTWLEGENRPLEGFSWRGGREAETSGILMWSEIFKITRPSGTKVAVIFIDTQGTFDNKSTVRECATVFALSALLSSIQVFNVFHNLREDDLQHLELFTEYGRLLLRDTGHKPFQKLLFLIRDWSWAYEKNYGLDGGNSLLEEKLEVREEQDKDQQSLRHHIRSVFTAIQCFLMPHPGSKVATNPNFDGRLTDIEDDFKTYLKELVPNLLLPENLILKEIAGQKIKVRELLLYFKWYVELFNGDDLPEPRSMLAATCEANILSAVATAKETYHRYMLKAFENNQPYMTREELDEEHKLSKAEALKQYKEKPKMGGDSICQSYAEKLVESIESDYKRLKTINKEKAEASNELAVAAGKDAYYRLMATACESARPYLNNVQFKGKHAEYRSVALGKFEEGCKKGDTLSDAYRVKLEQSIIVEYNRLYNSNKNKAESSNQAAIVTAKNLYHRQMTDFVENSDEPFLTSDALEGQHKMCMQEALTHFTNHSMGSEDEFSEKYKNELEKDVENDYAHFKSFNESNEKTYTLSAIAAAKENYNRLMAAVCEGASLYLTTEEFQNEHKNCKAAAIELIAGKHELSESFKNKMEEYIDADYNRLESFNRSKAKASNLIALSKAKETYSRLMMALLEKDESYLKSDEFDLEHGKCKTAALEQFKQDSKQGDDEFCETFRIQLDQQIEVERSWFRTQNESKAKIARTSLNFKQVRRMETVRDVITSAGVGAVIIGTAAAGPAGALFGAVWGGIMGRGISEWFRR